MLISPIPLERTQQTYIIIEQIFIQIYHLKKNMWESLQNFHIWIEKYISDLIYEVPGELHSVYSPREDA